MLKPKRPSPLLLHLLKRSRHNLYYPPFPPSIVKSRNVHEAPTTSVTNQRECQASHQSMYRTPLPPPPSLSHSNEPNDNRIRTGLPIGISSINMHAENGTKKTPSLTRHNTHHNQNLSPSKQRRPSQNPMTGTLCHQARKTTGDTNTSEVGRGLTSPQPLSREVVVVN